METIFKLIKENPKTSFTIIVAIIGVIFSYWRISISRKKLRIDTTEFENKKSKFSIYLENNYRIIFPERGYQFVIFNVKITNLANSKNSFSALLEIEYRSQKNELMTVKINHASDLFKNIENKKLTGLNTNIRVDEREIKSGWLIFNYPEHLNNLRIESFKIKIIDVNNNTAEISSVILKDIVYENNTQSI